MRAPTHFTYARSSKDLEQGDILHISDDLRELLAEVHPHYVRSDYRYFVVLTQTCDLVRRGGTSCKTPYISICAVRPLALLLERQLRRTVQSRTEIEGKYSSERARNRMRDFVERLLNNNEPNYFYLHEDPALGIDGSHVAFLALSIAVKSDLHYQKCVDARVGTLCDPFKAKLGWLVGTMYSRVATPDWVPDHRTLAEFEQLRDELVDGLGYLWIPDDKLEKVKREAKKAEKVTGAGTANIAQIAADLVIKEKAKKDDAAVRAGEVLAQLGIEVGSNDLSRFVTRLKNDSVFSQLFK